MAITHADVNAAHKFADALDYASRGGQSHLTICVRWKGDGAAR